MGGAIARGLSQGSMIKPSNIAISDVNEKNLDAIRAFNPSIACHMSNIDCVKGADLIILAVKPWLVERVVNEIIDGLNYNNQVILSIAAGVTLDSLQQFFKDKNGDMPALFRVIPNTAIDVLESFSSIASWNTTDEQDQQIVSIFNQMGKAMLVPESQLNAYMSLASCGIAYAFRYIRAAMEGGVEMGIYPNVAKDVVLQTLKGAVALLEANGTHPEAEVDKVTTPGGITIKGLNEMEQAGFSAAVIRGLKASHLK